MNRRQFLSTASTGVVAAGTLMARAPAVFAQPHYAWKMVTAWPKDFPGLGTGANNLAQHIARMSDQRLTITHLVRKARRSGQKYKNDRRTGSMPVSLYFLL